MVYRVNAPREIRGIREKARREGRYGVYGVYRVGCGDAETGDLAAVESTEEQATTVEWPGSVRHDSPTPQPHLQAQRAHPTRPEEDAFLLQLHNAFEGELSLTTEDHVSELLREAAGRIGYLECPLAKTPDPSTLP